MDNLHCMRFIVNVMCGNSQLVIPLEAYISRKIYCVKKIAWDMRHYRCPSTDVTTQIWWWGQSRSYILGQKTRLQRISSAFQVVVFMAAILPKFYKYMNGITTNSEFAHGSKENQGWLWDFSALFAFPCNTFSLPCIKFCIPSQYFLHSWGRIHKASKYKELLLVRKF